MVDDPKGSGTSEDKAPEKPFAVSAPQLTLPKGGGAISGIGEKFAANPVTGTGSLTVPIALSPGRSGFSPQLTLSYDSGAGNGPFGLGWSVSLPSITRRTDKGMPQYDDAAESDTFILSGAEDLVPVLVEDASGGWKRDPIERDGYVVWRYRPRIEGLFPRVERWTRQSDGDTYWRSISRDNVTTFYGKTSESRISHPADQLKVFTWLISESRDDKGNAIVYEYVAEDSSNIDLAQANERNRTGASRAVNRYLKRIKYGNALSTLVQPDLSQLSWLFEAVFDYGEGHITSLPTDAQGRAFVAASLDGTQAWPARQDPFSRYRACFEIRSYRLCRRVLIFHHFPDELGAPDYLVRATEFTYRESPVASFITGVTQSGFIRQSDDTYFSRALPTLEFEYTAAEVQSEVQEVDAASLANLPANVDGTQYQWLDLDGEGLQGVLASYDEVWYYKRNLSPLTLDFVADQPTISAQFENIAEVAKLPAFAQAKTSRHQFLDLAGDGRQDCVVLDRPGSGFYKRTADADWENFTMLQSAPNVDWNDPNLRFIDLNGDGHADVLVAEHDVFSWYPSLAETGFDTAFRVAKAMDEEQGPAIVFADGTQSIFLADMTGDGLTDIVRVRNGAVCYWPNIGYGHFGAKITMDNAPWFEAQDLFDPRRVRLADIDGSGTADIIYLASGEVRLHFNQSGNCWSDPQPLPAFPRIDDLAAVQARDLMGNGTACLVWMSSLPNDTRRHMRYVDLMGGQKPHLLVCSKNNLGAETHVRYAPSTKFYLADREAGQPWITRLPFPVQVVERVETYDRISRNRFVTRYAYHHGFYDGIEREFRGFGRVDHWDTEEFATLSTSGTFPTGDNIESSSHVAPVLSKTWFHTGAYLQEGRISKQFEREYYREGDEVEGVAGLTDQQLEAMLIPDTIFPSTVKMQDGSSLPWNLSGDELREACRALKGSILRQEIYGLDGSEAADRPYSVAERNYTIECLQPVVVNRHAVFFTHPREAVNFHYERKLFKVAGNSIADPASPSTPDATIAADPRVSHAVTLEVDTFGNVLKSVAIGYARRFDDYDPVLSVEDKEKQKQILLTYSEIQYTNPVLLDDAYRTPLPTESSTYELIHVTPDSIQPQITNLFRFDELQRKTQAASDGNHDLPYEDIQATGATSLDAYRRLIERVRTLYRKDDLTGPLPFSQLNSLALPFESCKLAFTPGLLTRVFADRVTDPVLGDDGGYVHCEGDYNWWIPSGQVLYSTNENDTPMQELAFAQAHFYLPHRFRDPFGNTAKVTYDAHNLLVQQTTDPLGNVVSAEHDYRVLQPFRMTDPNGNGSEVAFDVLGLVAGTAVMGKVSETRGDSLNGFVADLDQAQIEAFLAAPLGPSAPLLLAGATTRIVYDVDRFRRLGDITKPAYAATLVRETHLSDPLPAQGLKIQVGFSFSDGFGREIQKKIQAEPGSLTKGGPVVNPRWVSSGWTIFNNKGKPVRQYEPFFDDTNDFRFGNQVGVSSTLFYDPVERVVATLHPNHTYEKVIFDPWRQESWDVNDTVLQSDPRQDSDVAPFFERLPDADYLPTWHDSRKNGQLGLDEQDAANKAAVHASTPSVAHADTLGRTFLTFAHNKFERKDDQGTTVVVEDQYATRIELDIEGNQRAVTDAKDRKVMTYDYDMLSAKIHQASMEAGERWMLNDVTGKPICSWDSRGHAFRTEYDSLRRPVRSFVRGTDAKNSDPRTLTQELLFAKTDYGEGQPNDSALNLRTRVLRQFDGAGVVTQMASNPATKQDEAYDFKGNLLRSTRQLVQDYKSVPDWSGNPALDAVVFTSSTTFDALNRPLALIAPDNSLVRPGYNEANLLETMTVNLQGSATATPFVTNIDCDAKGQRELIEYGNNVRTEYEYDPLTFRLIRLYTSRRSADFPSDDPTPPNPPRGVQNLSYAYDPAGNITTIRDDAQQTVYFNNQVVEASADYVYDAIYRLIQATGREHVGQVTTPQTTWDDKLRTNLAHPQDGQAMRNYTEQYDYDEVGNFLHWVHHATNGNWVRDYNYQGPSLIEPSKFNNRLSGTVVHPNADQPIVEAYPYDAHGNMTAMPHLSVMAWDFKDQMQATSQQVVNSGTPETTYYVYDAAGQRVRKVTERQAGAGQTPVQMRERIYLGGFEIYREYQAEGKAVQLQRESLHVMDDKRRIALVETRTEGNDGSPAQLIRYQFGNHLGSAALELDDVGQVISHEEYYPYGSTSYQAGRMLAEVSSKRYRYIGRECDEESGLHYHKVRYYASWLGRWTAADRAGLVDGNNLYTSTRCNPINGIDPNGEQDEPPPEATPKISPETSRLIHQSAENAMSREPHLREHFPFAPAAPEPVGPPTREEAERAGPLTGFGTRFSWSPGVRTILPQFSLKSDPTDTDYSFRPSIGLPPGLSYTVPEEPPSDPSIPPHRSTTLLPTDPEALPAHPNLPREVKYPDVYAPTSVNLRKGLNLVPLNDPDPTGSGPEAFLKTKIGDEKDPILKSVKDELAFIAGVTSLIGLVPMVTEGPAFVPHTPWLRTDPKARNIGSTAWGIGTAIAVAGGSEAKLPKGYSLNVKYDPFGASPSTAPPSSQLYAPSPFSLPRVKVFYLGVSGTF
jgi:RHS repeat-associated protein